MKVDNKLPTSTRGAALRAEAQEKRDAAGGEKIAAQQARATSAAEKARYTDAVEKRAALLDEAKQLRAEAADKLRGAVGARGMFGLENVARGFATLMNKLAGKTFVTVESLKADPEATKTAAALEKLAAQKDAEAQKHFEVAQRSWTLSTEALAKAEGHEATAAAHTEAAAKLMKRAKRADVLAHAAESAAGAAKAGLEVLGTAVKETVKKEGRALVDEAKRGLEQIGNEALGRARGDLRNLLQLGIDFLKAAVDAFFDGVEAKVDTKRSASTSRAGADKTAAPKNAEPPSAERVREVVEQAAPHVPPSAKEQLNALTHEAGTGAEQAVLEPPRLRPTAAATFDAARAALLRGDNVSASSRDAGPFAGSGIEPSHTYEVVSADSTRGAPTVTVRNAWSGAEVTLSAAQFAALFEGLHAQPERFEPGKVHFAPGAPRPEVTIKGPRIDEPPAGDKKISESFLAARWAAEAAGIDWSGKGAGELKKLIETHKGGLKLSHGASPFEAKKRLAERLGLPTNNDAVHAMKIDDVRTMFAQREALGLARLASKTELHKALDAIGLPHDAALDTVAMTAMAKAQIALADASKELKADLDNADKKAAFDKAAAALDASKRTMLDVLGALPAGDRHVLALDACDAVEAGHGKPGATTKLGAALEKLSQSESFVAFVERAVGAQPRDWKAAAQASEWVSLGELGAPSSVLAYPGPLTDAQRKDVIVPLAGQGVALAKKLALLDERALDALAQHQGYAPDAPAGAQLLGFVRQLAALADKRDFRTREQLSKDDIVLELLRNAGLAQSVGRDGKAFTKSPPSVSPVLARDVGAVIDEVLKALR